MDDERLASAGLSSFIHQPWASARGDLTQAPLWSPDGRRIAFRNGRCMAYQWTHIRKLSGSPRDRRLLKGVAWDWLPDR